MIINQAGLDLIKEFEGFRSHPYQCSAGVWTTGYGHTNKVTKDTMGMSLKQAEEVLKLDVQDAEKVVTKLVKVPLTENQFSALVSLVFNCGPNPLKLTLGKKLNNGDYIGAAKEFVKWNRARSIIVDGLTRRRVAEKKLFESKV
jgi:lysozyme